MVNIEEIVQKIKINLICEKSEKVYQIDNSNLCNPDLVYDDKVYSIIRITYESEALSKLRHENLIVSWGDNSLTSITVKTNLRDNSIDLDIIPDYHNLKGHIPLAYLFKNRLKNMNSDERESIFNNVAPEVRSLLEKVLEGR